MKKQSTVLMTPALWDKAMNRIRVTVGEEAFTGWIAPLMLEDVDSDTQSVVLSVPNMFYQRWIEKRYMGDIEEAFSACLGEPVSIVIQVAETDITGEEKGDMDQETDFVDLAYRRERTERPSAPALRDSDTFALPRGNGAPATHSRELRRAPGDAPAPLRLNPRYLFDDFVVGESNRYAHAAALAVSDPKAKAFNPLFIYGGSGLGKTHLMQAIGHHMAQQERQSRVVYVTSEQFMNTFIDSIQNKTHGEFRNAYRNVDLLLIDDVQFFMGKERTQHEFFHTFNALYDAGSKIVVTSDRPPKDLSTLEERLRSRFEWGLLVDIQPPDLETRIAILRKKAESEGVRLPNDVMLFIAERVTSSIREMEGALKRLRMASSLHSRPIDLASARDILGTLMVGSPQPRVTVEDVQRAVCNYFGIKREDLLGANRSKKFSQPRHMAQYLCRKLTDFSFPDIAQKFGGKDHTSIIYACRKMEASIAKDPNIANMVAYLSKQVTKGSES